jgi:predicted outer membrane protein
VCLAVLFALVFSVFQSWSSGEPGTGGWVQTQWGPLGPADRDLLVKVRLAGLWEAPTGQQAAQRGSSPAVRELGAFLAVQHAELDAEDRKVADQLGVLVPTSATQQQQAWMAEISAATGADYDRIFVQRLREAHGIVLPVIAEVRSSTRNDLVREFANLSDQYVTRHMQRLEATGLVDFHALPDHSPGLLSGARSPADLVVPLLVLVASLLGAAWLFVGLRRRSADRPARVVAPAGPPPPLAGPPLAGPPPLPRAAIPAPRAPEISGPINGLVTGPTSGPPTGPIGGPIGGPVSGSMSGPISGPASGPLRVPFEDPLISPGLDPLEDPLISPGLDPLEDPLISPGLGPAEDPRFSPGTGPHHTPSRSRVEATGPRHAVRR